MDSIDSRAQGQGILKEWKQMYLTQTIAYHKQLVDLAQTTLDDHQQYAERLRNELLAAKYDYRLATDALGQLSSSASAEAQAAADSYTLAVQEIEKMEKLCIFVKSVYKESYEGGYDRKRHTILPRMIKEAETKIRILKKELSEKFPAQHLANEVTEAMREYNQCLETVSNLRDKLFAAELECLGIPGGVPRLARSDYVRASKESQKAQVRLELARANLANYLPS